MKTCARKRLDGEKKATGGLRGWSKVVRAEKKLKEGRAWVAVAGEKLQASELQDRTNQWTSTEIRGGTD